MSIRKKVLLSTFMFALVAALGTFAYVAKKGKININADTITPSVQHWLSAKYFGYITSGGTTDTYTWEANNIDLFNSGDSAGLIVHKTVSPETPNTNMMCCGI
jgi:hypothetical protein